MMADFHKSLYFRDTTKIEEQWHKRRAKISLFFGYIKKSFEQETPLFSIRNVNEKDKCENH